ncbi:hypothetical protein BHE74_00004646 [Ensete ventricosum]|nr:hypothetical protein BHE74_00004646 [Ensete ventricosum]
MPSLKRCKAEEPSFCDDGGGEAAEESRRKRQRDGGGSFPLEMLGDLSGAGIPYLPDGLRQRVLGQDLGAAAAAPSWCTEVSFSGASEVVLEERRRGRDGLVKPAVTPPPVVRTSRGRSQALPSRFRNSVLIDPWKKEKSKSKASDSEFFVEGNLREGNKKNLNYKGAAISAAVTNSFTLLGAECYRACRNFITTNCSTSRSTLTSLDDSMVEAEDKYLQQTHNIEESLVRYPISAVAELNSLRDTVERREDWLLCESCGLKLPYGSAKKMKHTSLQLLCKHCAKLELYNPSFGDQAKNSSAGNRKEKILSLLQDSLQLILVFYRCQIAVHQECYGALDVQNFTSWVCRACETPLLKRECCLCPVKGKINASWNNHLSL